MTYDFDSQIQRRHSGSYKWDADHGQTTPGDMIPLWVADMDFRTAPAITDALRRRVDHGVFGYTLVPDEYYRALTGWFESRHGYTIDPSLVIYTSGVVPAISAIIKALTRPGDGVIVTTPVYNCFFSSIRNNDCRVMASPLVRRPVDDRPGFFTYHIDLAALRALMESDTEARVMLLCNPHNPGGRTWNYDELLAVAEMCREFGVTLVSDEIHCDLTLPGNHFTSAGTLPEDLRRDIIICNSPSKAFNTAGLQIANIICGNENLRTLVDRAININEVCDVNPFGVAGLIAAYTDGADWLAQLNEYLAGNYALLCERFGRELPELPMSLLQATYLAWIDISALRTISADALEDLLLERAHVWINSGSMYMGDGYIRINFACPRARLSEALDRIIPVLRQLIDINR